MKNEERKRGGKWRRERGDERDRKRKRGERGERKRKRTISECVCTGACVRERGD